MWHFLQKYLGVILIIFLSFSVFGSRMLAQDQPEIRIELTVTTKTAKVGETVGYRISITNSGSSDLTNVKLNVPRLGIVDSAIYGGRVSRGAVGIIQGTFTILPSDLPGPLTIVAIVRSDQTGSPSATATITINGTYATPEIDPIYIGQTVNWQPIRACDRKCVRWQLYQTNETGDWEIFRLDSEDSEVDSHVNISDGVGKNIDDIAPSRSPNGEWVTFASNRDGNWEIYIARSDGSSLQRVTENDQASDLNPIWGPNNLIVYQSNREGNWKLYLFDTVTGLETRLTDSAADDVNPTWAPDGIHIAFQTNRDNRWQIYDIQPQTGLLNHLSNGDRNDYEPVYSPDGKNIALRTVLDGKTSSNIAIMGERGGSIIPVTNFEGHASHPSWSADSQLLAYQSDVDGDEEIYLFELETGNTRQLTNNKVSDTAPAFLCEGTTLLFNSDVGGKMDIYQMDVSKANQPAAQQFTSGDGDNLYPQDGGMTELSSGAVNNYVPEIADNRPSYPVISLSRGAIEPLFPRMTIWSPVNACENICPAWSIYTGKVGNNWAIFRQGTVDAEPINLARITNGNIVTTPDNLMPTVSPNGEWVVFTSNRDKYWELYMASTDGQVLPRRMTFTKGIERNPVWSPAGQSILYESNRDGNWELYQMDISSGQEIRLTYNDADETNARWSPDASRIVFQSNRTKRSQIYLLDLQTNLIANVSNGAGEDSQPVFAADGRHIAFRSVQPNTSNGVIVVKDVDDGSTSVISDPAGNASFPTWANSGLLLAYQSQQNTNWTINVYDAATQQNTQPISSQFNAFAPAWHCDGNTLFLNIGRDESSNIYVLDTPFANSPPIDSLDKLVRLSDSPDSKIYAPYISMDGNDWQQTTQSQ